MITEELEEPEFRGNWTFDHLIEYWKNPIKLEPIEFAFNQSMSLLAQADNNILRLRSRVAQLESDVADYRAREATIDVMTLRSEVRALQNRVNALETTLKLYQRGQHETAKR